MNYSLDLMPTIEKIERNNKPNVLSLAEDKYEALVEEIEDFQKELSDEIDVCVQFVSFSSTLMQVTEIGYQNPDLIYFYGYINGKKAQLIQHMSQLNFLLMAVPKENPEDKPRRIGFLTS